ncbi:hypothetical protein NUW58_g9039 [Xylaria curta]|uniref:Uncharacterized protein n=1 Tax=Xylaria curta TaxID=42375 RepID=A0ACC1N190_9PEZI|nr:hypothetical protein NUW58_g9039 [Xylaria curta]
MDLETMDHTFSHTLMSAAASPGDALRNVFDVLTNQKQDELPGTFGGSAGADKNLPMSYHELARPVSLFNWEIGLHSVPLAMDRFFTTQQFEEALQVARLVFDPTTETKTASRKRGTNLKVADIAKDKDFNLAVMERRTQGAWFTPRRAADLSLRRGVAHFGPRAAQDPEARKQEAVHFQPTRQRRRLVRARPPLLSPRLRRAEEGDEDEQRTDEVVCYLHTTYFCVPINPKFKQMRSLVNERLFNIRNSLDIQGRLVTYALIEPPIDPAALIALGSPPCHSDPEPNGRHQEDKPQRGRADDPVTTDEP